MFSSSFFLLAIGAAALLCETTAAPSIRSGSRDPRSALLASLRATVAIGALAKAEPAALQFASRQRELICSGSEKVSQDGQLHCSCSPTGGPVNKDAKKFLDEESGKVVEYFVEQTEAGVYSAEVISMTTGSLLEKALLACADKYGDVACVDADASERVLGEDKFTSLYCKWNLKTGANLKLLSPTEECILTLGDAPACTGNSSGDREGSESSGAATSAGSNETENGTAGGPSEGCVDARALPPCRRIHAHDITADVLCTRGLCATPNHELVVDGSRTSMGVLCESAVCAHARMLVNTCYYRDLPMGDHFVHAASGIGVTSWDVRFPRLATMLFQDVLIMARAVTTYFSDGVHVEL